MRAGRGRWALALLLLCAAGAMGCGHTGSFVSVDNYKDAEAGPDDERGYQIGPGDVLNVQVWNQPGMSGRARVRADGMISLPFLNDVAAAGSTPNALAQTVQTRLREFINNPVVTLTLEESRPLSIPVLGEVSQTGVFSLEPGSGVLQALAAAGGLSARANDEHIFVLRRTSPDAAPARIRFTYEALTRAQGAAGAFKLKPGDIVVVE